MMIMMIMMIMAMLRCGYHPDQYPSQREWDARLMMERSRAIKSPSIHYHLAGTKKVTPDQSQRGLGSRDRSSHSDWLAGAAGAGQAGPGGEVPGRLRADRRRPSHLHRTLLSRLCRFRDITTKTLLTTLLFQDEIGDKNFAKALACPDKFVLKPQREGGGNNVYGEDIKPFLEKIRHSEERNAYILMDRIHPPVTKASTSNTDSNVGDDCPLSELHGAARRRAAAGGRYQRARHLRLRYRGRGEDRDQQAGETRDT